MNHIKWIDFNPNNYEEYKAMLLPAFKILLPNNGKHSFQYHFKRYNYMSLQLGLKETINDEIDRFKSYIIETYKIDDERLYL